MTYDIADDRRRNEVFKTMHGFGDWAQYSVFFCELNDEELVRLRRRLHGIVNHREDQVLIVELGAAVRPLATAVSVVGRAYDPPVRTLVV